MRFISPSFLAFALLMSLLPWVEVRCDQVAPTPLTGYAVVTQNGWQTVWGETTGNAPNVPEAATKRDRRPAVEPDVEPAPLVGVFLGLAVAGIILGYSLRPGKVRLAIMVAVCLGAAGALGAQTALGFPLKKKDPPSIQQYIEKAFPNNPEFRGPNYSFRTAYTPFFYLTLVAAGGAAVGVLAEALTPPRRRRRWEDEEYDEDRPWWQKRRPRYEDDDPSGEDDPPRYPRGPRRPRDDYYR
jgi:hypothetical protein